MGAGNDIGGNTLISPPETGEIPVSVSPQGIDAAPRRTGHSRTDLLIAACAIFMSILSLLIAFNQARMTRQQVAATSWPLLHFDSDNTANDAARSLVIRMSVQNDGVGPAIVKNFTMKYGAKSYSNVFDFLSDCCGYRVTTVDPTQASPGTPLTTEVAGTVIRPGESADFITMPLSKDNASTWRRLDRARFQLSFAVCYCSVLGECWNSNLINVEPQAVASCAPRRQ